YGPGPRWRPPSGRSGVRSQVLLEPAGDAVAAGEGEVSAGDAEPDRGGDGAGDGLVDVGPQFSVLIGDGDAALTRQVVPVIDKLLDRRDAVVGAEHVDHVLEQDGGVDV